MVWTASICNAYISHICPRVNRLHALLPTYRPSSDPPDSHPVPPPNDATWTNYHEYVAETRLQFHTAYEQARQYLKGQQKHQHALYNAKVHSPKYTEGQMVFRYDHWTPQGLSPKLHSFWRGLYKITQVISEMTYKICEIETNKELIVHSDSMKPCRSPPGGFVPPTSTPPALMQTPNEILPILPLQNDSLVSVKPTTGTPTDGPVPVSTTVPTVQLSAHTTFAWPTVANDSPPPRVLCAQGGGHIFKLLTWFQPCLPFLKFPHRQFLKLFLQQCCFLHVWSWRPTSGAANRHPSFPVRFPHKHFNTKQNSHATATSN